MPVAGSFEFAQQLANDMSVYGDLVAEDFVNHAAGLCKAATASGQCSSTFGAISATSLWRDTTCWWTATWWPCYRCPDHPQTRKERLNG